jgi:hypothetical protein
LNDRAAMPRAGANALASSAASNPTSRTSQMEVPEETLKLQRFSPLAQWQWRCPLRGKEKIV